MKKVGKVEKRRRKVKIKGKDQRNDYVLSIFKQIIIRTYKSLSDFNSICPVRHSLPQKRLCPLFHFSSMSSLNVFLQNVKF